MINSTAISCTVYYHLLLKDMFSLTENHNRFEKHYSQKEHWDIIPFRSFIFKMRKLLKVKAKLHGKPEAALVILGETDTPSISFVNCAKNTGNLNCVEYFYCLGYSYSTSQWENNTPSCYYHSLNPRGAKILFLKFISFSSHTHWCMSDLKRSHLRVLNGRQCKGKIGEKKLSRTVCYYHHSLWKYCLWPCTVHSLFSHMWHPCLSFQQW